MSDPVDYARSYSFTGYQANNPSRPLPGQQVDAELENVAEAIRQTNDALGEVRRSDGKLANNVVTVGSLTADVTALMTGGSVSAWATPVAWAPGLVAQIAAPATTCTHNGETYLAAVAHTAGAVFESVNWIKLAAKGAAGAGIGDMLAANNLSDLTDLAQARSNLGANNATNLNAGTLASARLPASLAAVHGLLPAANKAPYYTSASAADLYDLTAFGRSFLGSADASVGRVVLGATAMGSSLFTAVDAAAVRTAIGMTTAGATLAMAANAAAQRTALGVQFSASYESPQQAITAGGTITLTHGLGAAPLLVQVWAVCVTASDGLAVGEQFLVPPIADRAGVGNLGASAVCSTAQIKIIIGSVGIYRPDNTYANITLGNFRLVVRAYV